MLMEGSRSDSNSVKASADFLGIKKTQKTQNKKPN